MTEEKLLAALVIRDGRAVQCPHCLGLMDVYGDYKVKTEAPLRLAAQQVCPNCVADYAADTQAPKRLGRGKA